MTESSQCKVSMSQCLWLWHHITQAVKCSLRLSDLLQSLRANSATENLQENGAFRGTWTAKSAKACDASHQPWVWKQFLASLLFSLSTCRLCGSVDTSLSTNVILLQSPTLASLMTVSDVCVIQNIFDPKRNSETYTSALEVLGQCAVFI